MFVFVVQVGQDGPRASQAKVRQAICGGLQAIRNLMLPDSNPPRRRIGFKH